MKKIIIALLVFAPLVSFASLDTNLYYGLRKNNSVIELQEFLIDKGFLTGSATGNFYSLTLNAVKKYQASENISQTGYVGILTRTAINNDLTAQLEASNAEATTETSTTTPTTTPASEPQKTTNDAVKALQDQLNALIQQLAIMQQQQTTLNQIQQNTQQIQQNTTPAPTTPVSNPQTTQSGTSALSISLGNITANTTSAHIGWNTNIPTNSKVFFTLDDGSIKVISSSSGYSTQHFIDISNLKPNTQYSYTIEVINGTQDQKLNGVINTNALPPTNIIASPTNPAGCPNSPTITLTPETGNALNAIYKVTADIQGDIITYHIGYNDPKWGVYPEANDNGFPVYLDVLVTDPCFLPRQLGFSYDTTSVHDWANPHLWNAGNEGGEAFIVSQTPTTTPQTVSVRASEPNGGTTIKTITVIAQY